jgi:hypothetical protein
MTGLKVYSALKIPSAGLRVMHVRLCFAYVAPMNPELPILPPRREAILWNSPIAQHILQQACLHHPKAKKCVVTTGTMNRPQYLGVRIAALQLLAVYSTVPNAVQYFKIANKS